MLEIRYLFELKILHLVGDGLDDVPLIIVLPHDDPDLVAGAYRFFPRYVAYSDSSDYLTQVRAVIEGIFDRDATPAGVHRAEETNGRLMVNEQ